MNILLDTHTAIWLLDGSSAIPASALRPALDDASVLFVSDISVWEVAVKHMSRPDVMPGAAQRFMDACDRAGFQRHSLSRSAILRYAQLDISRAKGVHKDPFDRVLIAQAADGGLFLLTYDRSLALYGEPCVLVM